MLFSRPGGNLGHAAGGDVALISHRTRTSKVGADCSELEEWAMRKDDQWRFMALPGDPIADACDGQKRVDTVGYRARPNLEVLNLAGLKGTVDYRAC
jgi:hypothetical protein